MAEAHETRGDYRAAAICFDALAEVSGTVEALRALARMERKCRAYGRAIAALLTARAHAPDALEPLRELAETAMLAQDFALGQQCWAEIIDRLGRQAHSYAVLRALACHRQLGDEEGAQALLGRSAAILQAHLPPPATRMLCEGVRPLRPGLYMITGNNGTGKTTLGHFLQALGDPVIDADTEIAFFSRGAFTSEVRHDLKARACPEAPEAPVVWIWDRARFDRVRACATGCATFLIGGNGQLAAGFAPEAVEVFHLVAPDDVIAARLSKRDSVSHRVGSHGYRAALRRNARAATPPYRARILRSDRPVWEIGAAVHAPPPDPQA